MCIIYYIVGRSYEGMKPIKYALYAATAHLLSLQKLRELEQQQQKRENSAS